MGFDVRGLVGTAWQHIGGSSRRSGAGGGGQGHPGGGPQRQTSHAYAQVSAPHNPRFVNEHGAPLPHGTRVYGKAGENPPFHGEIEEPGELRSVRQGSHDLPVISWPAGQPIKLVHVSEQEPELTGDTLEHALSTAREVTWHYAPHHVRVAGFHPLVVGEEGAHSWTLSAAGPSASIFDTGEHEIGHIGPYIKVKASFQVKGEISVNVRAGHEREGGDAVDFGRHAYWNRRIGEWVFSGGAFPAFRNHDITDQGLDFVHEYDRADRQWKFGVQCHFTIGGSLVVNVAFWFLRAGAGLRRIHPPNVELSGGYPVFHGSLETPFGLNVEGELSLELAFNFEPDYPALAAAFAQRFAAQFGGAAAEGAGGGVVAEFGADAVIGGAISAAFVVVGVATVAAALFTLMEGDEIEHAASHVGPTADRLALGFFKGLRGEDRPSNHVEGVGWDAGEQHRTDLVEGLHRDHPETSTADFALAITDLADQRRLDLLSLLRRRFWRMAQEAVWQGYGRAHRDDINALWEMNNAFRWIFQSEPTTPELRELRIQYPH